MSDKSKIITSLLVLVAIFLAVYFLNIGPFGAKEVCPPSKCKVYAIGPDGKPIGADFPKDETREHKEFSVLPPGFPLDMPIDKKPLQVVKSYVEAVKGNIGDGEIPHSQITYAYVTNDDAKQISSILQKYLKDKGLEVSVSTEKIGQPVITLAGHKIIEGGAEILVTVNIANQNLVERLVSISLLRSEIIKKTL